MVQQCGNDEEMPACRSGPNSILGELRIVSTWTGHSRSEKRFIPKIFWSRSTGPFASLSSGRHETEALLQRIEQIVPEIGMGDRCEHFGTTANWLTA